MKTHCSKVALTPNWTVFVRTYARTNVRTYVRASRWKILFTPYLVVDLSPSAEIWYVDVTCFNDGTQILTFLGIHNNRDFLNSRFAVGISSVFMPVLAQRSKCTNYPQKLKIKNWQKICENQKHEKIITWKKNSTFHLYKKPKK